MTDTEEKEELFQKLILQMKDSIKSNDVAGALYVAKKALKVRDSEKLRNRIKKMEDYITAIEEESAEEGEDMCDLGDGFYLTKELHDILYSYQREGVRWLWGLFKKGKGGILGDDMGLGKTIQIISLLAGLLDLQKIKNALIVLPLTLIANWQAEFGKWTPGIEVEDMHDTTKRQRERICEKVQRRGGIILITYGMILNNWELLAEHRGRQFVWDYVILDEGHKIKNATKTTKSVHKVPAANRLVLTGTPIQNNLLELWSLYDFVHCGTLLGTAITFKFQFANPILKSREKDATKEEKRLGERMAEVLRNRIEPFFLRRTKAEVMGQQSGDAKFAGKVPQAMLHKNDFVTWICLTDEQVKIYKDCLKLDMITEVLYTRRSPLVQLTILKKICDHPRLLSARMSECLGLLHDTETYFDGDKMVAAQMLHRLTDDQLLRESCKLKFLIELLANLRAEGHKCLVFSQSRVMLDIIERILKNAGVKLARIDGTSTTSERQERIRKFENDKSYSVFLLTTQVGGVGITLTSANRVVIYDPSWNPALDSQAVDRVYRIGQLRSVVVYRLMTCGTVEERIYRRQVFKQSIHKQTVEKKEENICRYFSRQELRDMFTLEDPSTSSTQIQLERMHASSRKTTTELDSHIAFLYSIPGFFGISDHDLLFTVNTEDDDVLDDVGRKHVGDWMARANKLVDLECEMTDKARSEQGRFLKPVLPENQPRIPQGMLSSRKPAPLKKEDSWTPVRPTRPQGLQDEIDDLALDVEMLSPYKLRSHVSSANSQEPESCEKQVSFVIEANGENEGVDETAFKSFKPFKSFIGKESDVVDLVSPSTTSNVVDVSLVATLVFEQEHGAPKLDQSHQDLPSEEILDDVSFVAESEHSESGSILVPDSVSKEEASSHEVVQDNQSVVNESMNLTAIESVFPAPFSRSISAKGPLNSTRISSIAALRGTQSSEDEDSGSPMDESYHSVHSDDVDSHGNFLSFAGSPTTAEHPDRDETAQEAAKSPMDEQWGTFVAPAVMSPVKDRIRASKLRRSSMFIRVANDIQEDDDSYSDSGSQEDESDPTVQASVQSADMSAQSHDPSARSINQSSGSGDQSSLSSDQSSQSSNPSDQSADTSNGSLMDSPVVVTKPAKRKYKRIVVPSDSDTE